MSSVNSAETFYTANALNQYTAVNAVAPTYDADGNMTAYGDWTYAYSAENRMVSASFGGAPVASYAYDHRNRCVRETCGSATRRFIWDGWNIVAVTETDSAAQISQTTRYVWGTDISGALQGAGGVGGLLAEIRDDGSVFFPCYDANGNITEYADASGNIRAHYGYDAFGNITAQFGDLADTFLFRFSTKPFHSATGLYKYQLRDYFPSFERWAGRDPIEERGGLNLYAFVGNNPANKQDHLGLRSITVSKCHAHLILGHMDENDPIDWKFPDGCAYGGVVGCWPKYNNPPDEGARWPNVPMHGSEMLVGFLKWLFIGVSYHGADFSTGDYNEKEQERDFAKAVANALSQTSYTSIISKLCGSSCCCDEFVLNIQVTSGGWEVRRGIAPHPDLKINKTFTYKGKCPSRAKGGE